MIHVRRLFYQMLWVLFALTLLTGCGGVKGLGTGLGDLFKSIKLP